MGRHPLHYHRFWNSGSLILSTSYEEFDQLRRWELLYRTTYSQMVGARIRRLRQRHDFTQRDLLDRTKRPRGGSYSGGLLSRIEKGYANSPLYVYVHLAEALEIDPGRLMGSDETQKPINEAEMTLVRFLRRVGIRPDDAIARLAKRD